MTRIIGLLDCNSFFASCEKVFRPDWRDRPVVVLSNNDGCVVARSAEAKRFIEMGAPYFKIKELARRNGIIVRSANFPFYGDMSRRVMESLRHWTDAIEIYSIDEAFLDLTDLFRREIDSGRFIDRSLDRLGSEMVETVPRWTGIPVSFGVGPTKTLAKAANKIAKGRPDRYFSLMDESKRSDALKMLDLTDIWGVGRHLFPKFRRLGLNNADDLSRVDPFYMRKNFSVVQERLVRELAGEVCFDTEDSPEPRRNIQVSRSFGEMVTRLDDLESAVASFISRGTQRLRRQKSVASAVAVQLNTNRYRTDLPQYSPGIVAGFPRPTSDTVLILKSALAALRTIFREGYAYKKASILLTELTDETVASSQEFLFDPDPDADEKGTDGAEKRRNRKKLFETVDELNRTLGAGRLFFAAEGIDPTWRPSSEFVSPSFTTEWNDLPIVRAK